MAAHQKALGFGSRLTGWVVLVTWLSLGAMAGAQEKAQVFARWAAVSNRVAHLPLRAVRAEQALQAAALDWADENYKGVSAQCDRALRLAAKETRDAYVDARFSLEKESSAFRAQGPAKALNQEEAEAEKARQSSAYDQVLEHYAAALNILQAFRKIETYDQAVNTLLGQQAAWFREHNPKAAEALKAYQKDAWNTCVAEGAQAAETKYRNVLQTLSHFRHAATNMLLFQKRYTPEMRQAMLDYDEKRSLLVESLRQQLDQPLTGKPAASEGLAGWTSQAGKASALTDQMLTALPATMEELTGQCPNDIA
ncbi:MAG: hypothetical protein V2A34_07430, partial [Lentisphaerota bacterium]